MKIYNRIKYAALIFTGIQLFFNCSKQLDIKPISERTTDKFFNSEKDFEQAIIGAYSILKSYPNWMLILSEARSDNTYPRVDGQREFEIIGNFQTGISVLSNVASPWYNCYNGIMRTNLIIEKLESSNNSNVSIDENVKKRMTGEVKFLRAFFYFNLVRFYGEVPLLTKVVTASESLTIPRSPVSEIYNNIIIPDFVESIELLPNSPTQIGRAYKDAARGILATVYLTRSAPGHNIKGSGMNSNEFNKVIELVNQITSGGWVDDYKSIFSLHNENNTDIIFDIQFLQNVPGYGQSYVTLLLSEPYFKSLGLPSWSGNPGACNISTSAYDLFQPSDIRRDFCIQNGFIDEGGSPRPDKVGIKFLTFGDFPSTSNGWGLNFPVIRYTDLQMMKAEAILKGGSPGNQIDVDNIVNKVRKRAGIGPLNNVTFEQLMDERRREFMGEGLRWFDILRTPDVVERMNNWRLAEDIYNTISPIKSDFLIYPIPATEIDVKEGLYDQNPGY